MKAYFLYACLAMVLLISDVSRAQDTSIPAQTATAPPVQATTMPDGEISDEPICFNVVNTAPYTVYGTFVTNIYVAEGGTKARHRSNFRLKTNFKSEFCTYGPFYEGRKLELVLRTLIPIFSCKTGITGDIVIHGRRKPKGGADTWAVCLP